MINVTCDDPYLDRHHLLEKVACSHSPPSGQCQGPLHGLSFLSDTRLPLSAFPPPTGHQPRRAASPEGHAVPSACRALPTPIHLSGVITNETSSWKPFLPYLFEQERPHPLPRRPATCSPDPTMLCVPLCLPALAEV